MLDGMRMGEPLAEIPPKFTGVPNAQVLAVEQAAFEAKGKWVPFYFDEAKELEKVYNKLKRRKAAAYDVTCRMKEKVIYVRFKN